MIDAVADRAFEPARAAVEAGLIPGATLGIVTAEGRTAVRTAGWAAIAPEREPLTAHHWFDLASLTKPIATATMILTLAPPPRLARRRPLLARHDRPHRRGPVDRLRAASSGHSSPTASTPPATVPTSSSRCGRRWAMLSRQGLSRSVRAETRRRKGVGPSAAPAALDLIPTL